MDHCVFWQIYCDTDEFTTIDTLSNTVGTLDGSVVVYFGGKELSTEILREFPHVHYNCPELSIFSSREIADHEDNNQNSTFLVIYRDMLNPYEINIPQFKKKILDALLNAFAESSSIFFLLDRENPHQIEDLSCIVILIDGILRNIGSMEIRRETLSLSSSLSLTSSSSSSSSLPSLKRRKLEYSNIVLTNDLVDEFCKNEVNSKIRTQEEYTMMYAAVIKWLPQLFHGSSEQIDSLAKIICRVSSLIRRNTHPISLSKTNPAHRAQQLHSCPCIGPEWVIDLPSQEKGWTCFEFFSGIGGMRLSLPHVIRGIPIKKVTAFDVSDVANQVYTHNFHSGRSNNFDNFDGNLRPILINGLKLAEVDGVADIWTMSPPCQPYTTTRRAKRLDDQDPRSQGIFHLMNLLLEMKKKPRWIFLENVQGFVGSSVLDLFLQVLHSCGYRFDQYLLSPIVNMGIPNHRKRYYLAAEHCSSPGSHRLSSLGGEIRFQFRRDHDDITPQVHTLERYLLTEQLSSQRRASLLLSYDILAKPWAATRLSIVCPFDRSTYCFTKSYGRLKDKSTGSCLLEDGKETLSDRTHLEQYVGRIRLFDPSEILLLSGFPREFQWPEEMDIFKQWACIGNSINVSVVNKAMTDLFDDL